MRQISQRLLIVALVAGVLLAPAIARAQVGGDINGRIVSEDTNEPLPGVTITFSNQDTGVTTTVVTNNEGLYAGKALKIGTYTVAASLEGMQTVQAENVILQVGQALDINFSMGVETVSEAITVTSESPLIEVSRSSASTYVGETEITALPIIGRDFTDFALLTPTVQGDPVRGFITMSGQRGIYTGLNVDGVDNKSAFFGYGLGGEATENDGLVIAQDSVREFQVVTSGFAPEMGADGGGTINVITKSGTNELKGSAFYFFRDDSLAKDLKATPLDVFDGRPENVPVDQFERQNWGASIGGAIKKDRTHYFFSYDQTSRDQPTTQNVRVVGVADAVRRRAEADNNPAFLSLLDGWTENADGTLSGTFLRSVDNLILFGKVDHQFNPSNSGSLRVNYSDFERISSYKDEESLKTEEVTSIVGQVVSVIGSNKVNEARIQIADNALDRLSQRVGEPIEAQVRFRNRDGLGSGSLGKFDFLPIFVEEGKTQFQDNFSYLFGVHDLKFGIDYRSDDLKQLFAGSLDGRYDFNTVEDFVNNDASNVRIYYGKVTFPNYDETQELLSLYAQDTWRPNDRLTISYGIRYGATYNPDNLPHLFPQGQNIPDDTNNWQPRFGFTYTPGGEGTDVVRGGIGLFTGRTPSLIFASQVQQNGIFPNFGRVNVQPSDGDAFVPCCDPINNENPPADAPNSPSYVDPTFEDAETLRMNLGYERQIGQAWSAGVDLVYAETDKLQSNIELNRTFTLDQFGRPFYSSTRPNPDFNEIFTRQSLGESEYKALTLKVERRFRDRYQFRAHYTYSEDRDTDSNERSATGVTVSIAGNDRALWNPGYDWGLSERDVKNRLLVSGLVELPWGFRVSGIAEYRSGRPWDPSDAGADFAACGFGALGFNCTIPRPVVNGVVLERNSGRNESITTVDLRLSKMFDFGDRYQIELFAEVFNLFDEQATAVCFGFTCNDQRDPTSDELGLGSNRVTGPQQVQLGARFRF